MSIVNKKAQPINPVVILVILGPFLTLDSIEIFGRHSAPEALGHFACSMLPFTRISTPLVSHRLVDFAQQQCTAQPHEPALSILFLMLKMTMAILTGVIMGIWIYIIPVWLLPRRLRTMRTETFDRITNAIGQTGGIAGNIKRNLPIMIGLVLFCFAVPLSRQTLDFKITPVSKIMEDGASLTVFVTTLCLVNYPISWIFFGMKTPTH